MRRYRGTSLIRNYHSLGSYSRPIPRALRWSWGGGQFLMSEVPLYQAEIAALKRYLAHMAALHQKNSAACLEASRQRDLQVPRRAQYTLHVKPYTLNPQHFCLLPTPHTLHPRLRP